jgi:SAM-dependent methyltransferase
MDVYAPFKQMQKQGWAHFAPLAEHTVLAAPRLLRHAGVGAGQRLLDVACGTGVVAVTAARRGVHVAALDLTPELLEHARRNADIAGVSVEWHEGDVEDLPFADATFDVVVSQFGHIFAPRPERAASEMARVLKPGGVIAFATWPPDLMVGRALRLSGRYLPPPPEGVAPPYLWGEPAVVRERLAPLAMDIVFTMGTMFVPCLSPQHHRQAIEQAAGPLRRMVAELERTDPDKLRTFRNEYDALLADFFEDNVMRQDFLLTRAIKR